MQEFSLSFGRIWVLVAIFIVVGMILSVYFYYRRTNPPVTTVFRTLLGILRGAAISLLVFCVAEPVLSFVIARDVKPHVAVLLDGSSSMTSVEDFDLKEPVLRAMLHGSLPGESSAKFVRDDYAFSDSLLPLGDTIRFDGQRTALGDALNAIGERYKAGNLQGVVVISDGIFNSGVDPVASALKLSVPVYTVDVGPQRSSMDIRVVNVVHDDIAYEGRPTKIEVEVESRGFDGITAPIKIRSGEKTLAVVDAVLGGSGARRIVPIEFTPAETGFHTYSVSLAVQPEEDLKENNSQMFAVSVLKSKQRILLAAGYLSWELTFLKRTLEKSGDFECELSVIDRQAKVRSLQLPRTVDKLSQFDLLIFIDYQPSSLAASADALSEYVGELGRPVMFMLGVESVKSFSSPKVAELLPFDTSRKPVVRSTSGYHLQLTEQGKYHPIMQIGEEASELKDVWSALPPFESYVEFEGEKAGAAVLAVTDDAGSGAKVPLIAISHHGKGKVLASACAPFWKLGFVSAGRGGSNREYESFIDNCVRWLAASDEVDRVRVAPDRHIFKSGEHVTFSASILDESYRAMDDGSVVLTVFRDSSTATDSLSSTMVRSGSGRFRTDLNILGHGEYSFRGDVYRGEKIIDAKSGKFAVEAFSLEEETIFQLGEALREISDRTGGSHLRLSEIDSLAGLMRVENTVKRDRHEYALSHHWLILAAVLLLLSAEWWIRKRLQLL
jgi:hypothetical protein